MKVESARKTAVIISKSQIALKKSSRKPLSVRSKPFVIIENKII